MEHAPTSRPGRWPLEIETIVSGGQSGVDRAALDVAFELGLRCGGWCPLGRKAEDGPIPERYPLRETPRRTYKQRTRWNVRDSDGTLILTVGVPTGGTEATRRFAQKLGKPHLVVDLAQPAELAAIVAWAREHRMKTLNVAGPRESTQPGVYDEAASFIRSLLTGDFPHFPSSGQT
jgi:hypothetical protein